MNFITFRAIAIGALGGLAAFLALGPGAGHGAELFALFVGVAGFYHFGGKLDGLKKTLFHYLFGAALGGLALVGLAAAPSDAPLGPAALAGIAVAVSLGLLVLASRLSALCDFPVAILAYASVAGAALADNRADKILAPSLENPLAAALLSLIAGALLGFVAETLAAALRKYAPMRGPGAQSAPSA
jgi:hypothetical protein